MKKLIAIVFTVVLVIAVGVTLWLCGYYNRKNMDNIPSKEIMVTYLQKKGEQFATYKIIGYERDDIKYIWGEPDGVLSGLWGDIWKVNDDNIVVYYNNDGKVEYVKLLN